MQWQHTPKLYPSSSQIRIIPLRPISFTLVSM